MFAIPDSVVTRALAVAAPQVSGCVSSITGLTVWIDGMQAAMGDLIELEVPGSPVVGEVIGMHDGRLAAMPLGPTHGLGPGVRAHSTGMAHTIGVGYGLLGRVLDGLGHPLDGGPALQGLERVGLENAAPNPLKRQRIDSQLALGVRAIDTFIPVGRGQRLGIFAGSGVGKSTLLSMIARGTSADIVVGALVGERGREVREFIENDLGPEGLARSVLVVATSDQPPVVRLRAAFVATRIAEWFRDQGADVLLMMDSITRTAMAQREVGLSAGEPPATRGYPPSVFAMMPKLLERAGSGETGTITGLYTVLVEGDDIHDPIGDTARSILDGHIMLDRNLATAGHFPSIDVLGSVSRVTGAITNHQQRKDATALRQLLAAHREAKMLIDIGAYVPGSDPVVDRARQVVPLVNDFLRQDTEDVTPLSTAWSTLHHIAEAS